MYIHIVQYTHTHQEVTAFFFFVVWLGAGYVVFDTWGYCFCRWNRTDRLELGRSSLLRALIQCSQT